MTLTECFQTFCNNLLISLDKRSTVASRHDAIAKRVNQDFRGLCGSTANTLYVGSYGRNTANSYVSDVDMIMILPYSTYVKYDGYKYNGQSALLNAVRNSILTTYSNTVVKGDGQIVEVSFSDGMTFEVLPAFECSDGSFCYPDSNNGGSWKNTNPRPEIKAINDADSAYNYNVRRLCRMARSWKYYCNVDISSFLIDTLAIRFMRQWPYRDKSYLYYDWMSRDFFKYLADQKENQTVWYAEGSGQAIYNLGNFRPKAKKAYETSLEAITAESEGQEWTRNQKWRLIYGYRFPD
ncbi:MAG: nucleotidyltransferase [Bacteroidales bacterium]|nr:nucleotidyltransferase [Bacteroidales bacterium]